MRVTDLKNEEVKDQLFGNNKSLLYEGVKKDKFILMSIFHIYMKQYTRD